LLSRIPDLLAYVVKPMPASAPMGTPKPLNVSRGISALQETP
jgi:hypothetical protein